MNIFTHVTYKTLKKNRIRTAVTIVGILLATAMLTAVTAIVSSLQSFMVRSVIAENGDWYGALYQISQEELLETTAVQEVEEAGAFQEMGFAPVPDSRKENIPYIFVAGMTEELYDMKPVKLVEGEYPKDSSEIIVSRNLRTESGKVLEIGDTISLDLGRRYYDGMQRGVCDAVVFENDGKTIAEELVYDRTCTYTVVGLMEKARIAGQGAAYYAITAPEEESGSDATFTCYYKTRKPSQIYSFINTYQNAHTAELNSELLRYKGVSTVRPFMRMLYGLSAILIVLIMVGGISLVYNSFAISVSDRTKQFGLLASIGATPRQMKRMVLKEAFFVSAIGIPVGILCGLGGIAVTLRMTGNAFYYLYSGEVPMRLAVSWPALLVAVVTALATVFLSACLPARRAAKISPMEAIRQTKDIRIPRKIRKSGRWSYRLFGLPGMVAGKHFTRSKRQYRATIFSLFISIVLFISASSFSTYLGNSITRVNAVSDYDISVYLNDQGGREAYKKLQKKLPQIEGVEEILPLGSSYSTILADRELLSEDYEEFIEFYGISPGGETEEIFTLVNVMEDEAYVRYLREQGLSVEDFTDTRKMQVVAVGQIEGYMEKEQRYRVIQILEQAGCTLDLKVVDYAARDAAWEEMDETGEYLTEPFEKTVQITVGAFADQAPMNTQFGGNALRIFLSESMFQALVGQMDDYLREYSIRVKAPAHQAVTERIENLAYEEEWGDAIYYVNDETEGIQTRKSLLFTLDVFTYGFIVLISLIAAANVFNTISTGFLLRRREFAVLTSVGMAPKEMRRMLEYECLLYGSKALLYGIPVSLLVTWQIYRVIRNGMDTGFYVPALSIVLAVCSVFAVVFATMIYARKKLEKENVIDSIRRESV